MELEFYGAAGRITGSCHILRINGHQILLDCGLIQGRPEEETLNREEFLFDPRTVGCIEPRSYRPLGAAAASG